MLFDFCFALASKIILISGHKDLFEITSNWIFYHISFPFLLGGTKSGGPSLLRRGSLVPMSGTTVSLRNFVT